MTWVYDVGLDQTLGVRFTRNSAGDTISQVLRAKRVQGLRAWLFFSIWRYWLWFLRLDGHETDGDATGEPEQDVLIRITRLGPVRQHSQLAQGYGTVSIMNGMEQH